MEQFMHAEFWLAVGQIIMIDILLGGDNAVVIALACRKLPDSQRFKGILWGTLGAIVLRVILIFLPSPCWRFLSSNWPGPRCWCGSGSSCWYLRTKMSTATSNPLRNFGAQSKP